MPWDKEPQAFSDWWIKQITPSPDETTKSPWRKQWREVGRNPGSVIFLLGPIWKTFFFFFLVWLRITKSYLKQQICVWFTSASGHTELLSSGLSSDFQPWPQWWSLDGQKQSKSLWFTSLNLESMLWFWLLNHNKMCILFYFILQFFQMAFNTTKIKV